MSYTIKLYSRAYRDLDDIYEYISQKLSEPATAAHIVDEWDLQVNLALIILLHKAYRSYAQMANELHLLKAMAEWKDTNDNNRYERGITCSALK